MISRVAMSMSLLFASVAASAQSLELRGTIGQQMVTMSIQFAGPADSLEVASAKYQYETQKVAVPLAEGKVHGTTVVLADDDGNVFHLHLLRADGTSTADVKAAQRMEGTMDRGELDLPVKLERVK